MAITYPLTFPSSPAPSVVEWGPLSVAGVNSSPYTLVAEKFRQSGRRLDVAVTYPRMTRAQGDAFAAVLAALDGSYGTVLFGPQGPGATPKGIATGTPLVKGASQVGSSLITDGWTVQIVGILKAGDFIQLGLTGCPAGILTATRIQTSGGTELYKYLSSYGTSVNNQTYEAEMWVWNRGAKAVRWNTNIRDIGTVQPGGFARIHSWSMGNGASTLQLVLFALVAGDALDCVCFAPALRRLGVAENLVEVAARTFATNWSAQGGASVNITQAQILAPTRLYQLTEDAESDSGTNALLNIYPHLRESPEDNAGIVISSPQGIFRLKQRVQWALGSAYLYEPLSFELEEDF